MTTSLGSHIHGADCDAKRANYLATQHIALCMSVSIFWYYPAVTRFYTYALHIKRWMLMRASKFNLNSYYSVFIESVVKLGHLAWCDARTTSCRLHHHKCLHSCVPEVLLAGLDRRRLLRTLALDLLAPQLFHVLAWQHHIIDHRHRHHHRTIHHHHHGLWHLNLDLNLRLDLQPLDKLLRRQQLLTLDS
jgi:hypothetical protein